jgi:hypothetical protein
MYVCVYVGTERSLTSSTSTNRQVSMTSKLAALASLMSQSSVFLLAKLSRSPLVNTPMSSNCDIGGNGFCLMASNCASNSVAGTARPSSSITTTCVCACVYRTEYLFHVYLSADPSIPSLPHTGNCMYVYGRLYLNIMHATQ